MKINRLINKSPMCSGNVWLSVSIWKMDLFSLIRLRRSFPKGLVLLILVALLSIGYSKRDVLAARESRASQNYMIFSPVVYKQSTYIPERVYVLENHSSYKSSSSGYLHILGEIQNDRHDIISNVVITATLLNKDKKALASESTPLYLNSLKPGDKTCFDITFTEIPSNWSTYEFDTSSYTIGGQRQPDISVTSSIPSLNDKDLEITGSVRNDDSVRVECVRPVGTIYNDSAKVIGCQDTYLNGSYTYLNKGSTGTFTLIYYGRDYTKWKYYRIQVGGILP